MDDRTTIDHGRERSRTPSSPSVRALLHNRPRERYVPAAVSCTNCGCDGAAFEWFQRLDAGALGDGEPPRERYFCSLVCLGAFLGAAGGDADPRTLPPGVTYE